MVNCRQETLEGVLCAQFETWGLTFYVAGEEVEIETKYSIKGEQ